MKNTIRRSRAPWWAMLGWLVGMAGVVWVTAGCAATTRTFTNPTGDITVRRQQFVDTYARVRQLYLVIYEQAMAACHADQLPGKKCLEIAAVHEQAKQLDFDVRAVIGVPETTIDWAMIEKVVGLAVRLVL